MWAQDRIVPKNQDDRPRRHWNTYAEWYSYDWDMGPCLAQKWAQISAHERIRSIWIVMSIPNSIHMCWMIFLWVAHGPLFDTRLGPDLRTCGPYVDLDSEITISVLINIIIHHVALYDLPNNSQDTIIYNNHFPPKKIRFFAGTRQYWPSTTWKGNGTTAGPSSVR